MREKRSRSEEERKELREKRLKVIKIVSIIAVVLTIVLAIFTPLISGGYRDYSDKKAIAIARLNVDGLTDEVIKSKDEISQEYGMALAPQKIPKFNVERYCLEFETYLQGALTFDMDARFQVSSSLAFNNATILVSIVTTGYSSEAFDAAYEFYAGSKQAPNIDRFICFVWDEVLGEQLVWEQTNFRLNEGKSPVPVIDPTAIRDLTDDYQLTMSLSASTLTTIDKYQGYLYKDAMNSELYFVDFNLSLDPVEDIEGAMNDYFALFKAASQAISEDPERVVIVDLNLGNDNRALIWVDKYRCNEYISMMSQFEPEVGQVYLLQYHLNYGYMYGLCEGVLSKALSEFGF